MSAVRRAACEVRYAPMADLLLLSGETTLCADGGYAHSFDNFNSLFANALGDRDPERRCCLQVDAHVE